MIEVYLKDENEPVLIGIDKSNQIVKYENKSITEIGDDFLFFNKGLRQLNLPNLTQVGGNFLERNKELKRLDLPNLTQVGYSFLAHNQELTELSLPNLTQVGDHFLDENQELSEIFLPNLTQVGDLFLKNHPDIRTNPSWLSKPRLKSKRNKKITSLNIALLDKENELTTSEISIGSRMINKIKSWFLEKKDGHEK